MRLIVDDGTRRREFEPADSPIGVGRLPSLPIQVAHPLVSRQHGRFFWQDGCWAFQDTSRHGSLLQTPDAENRRLQESEATLPNRCKLLLAGEGGYPLDCSLVAEQTGASPRELYRVAVQAQSKREWSTAVSSFLQLARREPPVADAMRRAAECLGEQGSLPEALVWAIRYGLQRPADPGGWKLLARLHGQTGSVDEARHCLQRARALDAGDPELAELEKRLASYDEAAQVMQLSTVEVLGRGPAQTLETEHFVIQYDFARHGRLLPDLAKGLEAAVRRCAELLPVPEQRMPVQLTDAATETGPALGERSAAAACDDTGIRIYLPPGGARATADAPFLVSLALHEVVHAVLLRRSATIPWWVHEGLAQYLSLGEHLGESLPAPEQMPDLELLETAPLPAEMEAGYGAAYFAVHALAKRLGRTGLGVFLESLGAGTPATRGLEDCGLSYPEVARLAWQRWRQDEPAAPPHLITLGEIPGRTS